MTFARRPEGDPERAYRSVLADLTRVPEERLRRRRVALSVVLAVALGMLVAGIVGLAANPRALGPVMLAVALTVLGTILTAQMAGGLVRIRTELRARRWAADHPEHEQD